MIYKPFQITGKQKKDNLRQLHLLLQQVAALQKSLLLFAITISENQAKTQQAADLPAAGWRQSSISAQLVLR
jgi:hypothetical protein